MSKPKLPAKITSTFALVELKAGRQAVAKVIGKDYRIPFTLSGYLLPHQSNVGHDDGVGIEFAAHVSELYLDEPIEMPCDKTGRPWATELDAGDKIELDRGFTCTEVGAEKSWRRRTVKAGEDGRLYFNCLGGRHYLDGQIEKTRDGTLYFTGVYKLDK